MKAREGQLEVVGQVKESHDGRCASERGADGGLERTLIAPELEPLRGD